MRYLFLFIIIILALSGSVLAQEQLQSIIGKQMPTKYKYDWTELSKPDAYANALSKRGSVSPNGSMEDCHSHFYSVILEYKDSKIQAPLFSEGATQEFKDFISKNLKYLEAIPWDTKIPEVKGLKNFRVFWIHCYLLENKSSKVYPWLSDDMISELTRALSFSQKQDGIPLFIAPPYYVMSWPTNGCDPPGKYFRR